MSILISKEEYIELNENLWGEILNYAKDTPLEEMVRRKISYIKFHTIKDEQPSNFLTELTSLSRKYGVKIEGCGCCGSPALMPIKPEAMNNCYEVDDKNQNLTWTKKNKI